jgi:hypothetical protein
MTPPKDSPKPAEPRVDIFGADLVQRFFDRVSYSDDCWEWVGAINQSGYGHFYFNDNYMRAHRWSYEYFKGEKLGHDLCCHHCDNPACVNPFHLFAGDHLANNRDMVEKGRYRILRGEDMYNARLTESQVKKIFYDNRMYAEIADDYGISRTQVQGIKSGKRWKHVTQALQKYRAMKGEE